MKPLFQIEDEICKNISMIFNYSGLDWLIVVGTSVGFFLLLVIIVEGIRIAGKTDSDDKEI